LLFFDDNAAFFGNKDMWASGKAPFKKAVILSSWVVAWLMH
jgi:hypothetical protein